MYKKNKQMVFVALKKSNNTICVATSKVEISSFVNVSVDTIRRHLIKNVYDTEEFTIWCTPLNKLKKRNNLPNRY